MAENFDWYNSVGGDDIFQGDIFEKCEVFFPPDSLASQQSDEVEFTAEERDVIVMSQTCDMDKKNQKISEILLCPLWCLAELTPENAPQLSSRSDQEKCRQGRFPAYHMLAGCSVDGLKREIRIVDFRHVYVLPLNFMRHFALKQSPRIRLLPPYREHLSQAYARFYMRVGLPTNIPSFK